MKRLSLLIALIIVFVAIPQTVSQAVSGTLTTTYTTNRGWTYVGGTGWQFDVAVLNVSEDVIITAIDINNSETTAYNVSLYYKLGSYVGSELNAGAWTLWDTVSVTGAGIGVGTTVDINDLRLSVGQTYGFYIAVDTLGNQSNETFGIQTFQDGNLRITAGKMIQGPFGVAPGLGCSPTCVTNNNAFSGALHYGTAPPIPPSPPGSPPIASSNFVIPNEGLVQISAEQAQPVYYAPAEHPIQLNGGELWLPADADGNGYDTYVVTEVRIVDGEVWVGIFLGSSLWGWVPLANVTPLSYIPTE